MNNIATINKLYETNSFNNDELLHLLKTITLEEKEYLFSLAQKTANKTFGNKIYIRGLIELTNYCKNDCLYCGIRASNKNCERYRLSLEQILECCNQGYVLGFRTFVLQGGEDNWYSDEKIVEILIAIKSKYPDCAITLSLGEKSKQSYQKYFDAGADRYLLRHETANKEHYASLHPEKMKLDSRIECLKTLKEIGFQVGTGFMVGSPNQTFEHLVEDIAFIKTFDPEMIGIGPFLPQHDTPFANQKAGSMDLTLVLISILRLLLPNALIPATTALGTIHPLGREKGILAGANVVMPNLSPLSVRKKYLLYDNKISINEESAEGKNLLIKQLEKIGYEIETTRGDHPRYERN